MVDIAPVHVGSPEHSPRHRADAPDSSLRVTGRTAVAARFLLAGLRIALGGTFLWTALDRLAGFGRGAETADSWLTAPLAAGIGIALVLGIGMRIAATCGAVLAVLMGTSVLPAATNPFVGDHLLLAAVLILLALLNAGATLGFGRRWAATRLVRRNRWLI
ncbi:thiosulfate dehydrogenase [quinone] large subunit [Actinoplanes lutulentus]|uniref:Thiosulfate dehydrogenase [quinone] large subunit n=1 Tax=Actinoplanes lutulentus TaxID=1287878 RepID=A0A327YY67_9ACTN|nr:hypothetical protein [Actinoplanes lutulentus]MBB2948943.1 thiosulfate dehydrogenase [quinone] large subunit [Actinoplanes lutulentus]RAK26274.1 thiosulfate dehydrogenase [quinone] large subunit [Actinoplanes lutulentus]